MAQPPSLWTQVADMHLLGFTQQQIADRHGISQQQVSKIIHDNRGNWRRDVNASYEQHVAEARALLFRLLKATESGLERGDPRSIEAATKLQERLCKLLGLDHADRMNERLVRVEESKTDMLADALVAVMDHLGVEGDKREEAFQIVEAKLVPRELV